MVNLGIAKAGMEIGIAGNIFGFRDGKDWELGLD